MQPALQTCPQCGSVSGLIGGIRSTSSVGIPPTSVRTHVLYFGRLFAWSKLVAGSALALMLVFQSHWLASLGKLQVGLSSAVSVAMGYGLLKRRMWGLYLLMGGFFFPIVEIVMAAERDVRVPTLQYGMIWNFIGLWYFWAHRKDLEK